MAYSWPWLFANLTSIVCAIGAVVAICLGVEHGWGWLLVIAWFTHSAGQSNPTPAHRSKGE